MKRVLFTLCMVLSTLLIIAGERFTIGKYTFEITSPTEVELCKVDKSVSSVNLSPTITYQGTTYRVTSIRFLAFEGCSSLTSVTIPNSVTSIGWATFMGCESLTSITIPNSVTSIGDYAFEGCTSLTSVTIPNSVTSIGQGAFLRCSSLTSITIPNSVTSIGGYAFSYCSSLTYVTIPNSVTSIGNYAFEGCTSLTSITIPNSVTSIEDDAFGGTGIYTNAANWKNGALYINNCLIKVEEDFMGDYAIKAGTRLIAGGAFFKCSSLTSVTIPNSVTSIGGYAFRYCSSLTSITIPNSVKSIGDGAFGGCTSLTSVTIPDSVTSIGDWAFSDCSSLTSITIPNSVTSIGDYAFYGTGIYNNAANWKNGVLYINNCLIKVEEDFMGDYAIKAGTRLIAGGAFGGCTSLTSITIPNSVTSIGFEAFLGCSSLTSVKYTGTKGQWQKIKRKRWTDGSEIQVIHCTDGEIRL